MKKLHKNFLVLVATGAVLAGCPADDAGTTDSDTDTSSTTAPTTTSTTMTTMSTSDTTSSTTDTPTTSTTTDPTSGTDSTGSSGDEIPPPPTLGDQLDRAGRPAISTAVIDRFEDSTPPPDHDDSVDAYNADDDPASWGATYGADAYMSLAIYDALDTIEGNQALYNFQTDCVGGVGGTADCYDTLAAVLMNDWLVVNSAGTDGAGYLGVEVEVITGAAMSTAIGGRTLTDDVIDTSYSVLSGANLQTPPVVVGDGVDGPAADPGMAFPYLADAN